MDNHVLSVFAVQTFVTTVVLTFCIGMLARGADPGVYLPVLTGITGFWFPSPLQHTVTSPTQTFFTDKSPTPIQTLPSSSPPHVSIICDPVPASQETPHTAF